jgi:hypothetical protein
MLVVYIVCIICDVYLSSFQPLSLVTIRDFVLLELIISALGPRGESICKMRMEDFADRTECPDGEGFSIRVREQKTSLTHGYTVSIPSGKVWKLLK